MVLDISLLKNNSMIGSKIAIEYYSKLSPRSNSIFEIKNNLKKTNNSVVSKLDCCYNFTINIEFLNVGSNWW